MSPISSKHLSLRFSRSGDVTREPPTNACLTASRKELGTFSNILLIATSAYGTTTLRRLHWIDVTVNTRFPNIRASKKAPRAGIPSLEVISEKPIGIDGPGNAGMSSALTRMGTERTLRQPPLQSTAVAVYQSLGLSAATQERALTHKPSLRKKPSQYRKGANGKFVRV